MIFSMIPDNIKLILMQVLVIALIGAGLTYAGYNYGKNSANDEITQLKADFATVDESRRAAIEIIGQIDSKQKERARVAEAAKKDAEKSREHAAELEAKIKGWQTGGTKCESANDLINSMLESAK